MQNLQKAAGRGYFTVPLSSGHERTLYIFADPQCPHCQDFEPLFEALSTRYNVEIFPVTYVGGKQSSQQIQPVLYLNKDQRAAAWKKLFSVDDGMLTIGKRKPVTIKKKPRHNAMISAGKSPARRWPSMMSRSANTISLARRGWLLTTAATYHSQ